MFVAPAMIWSNPAAPMIYYVLLVLLGAAAVVCMWSASPESLLILRVIVALCCSVAIGVMMLGGLFKSRHAPHTHQLDNGPTRGKNMSVKSL